MNVFEDLVVELKEENLLEETIIDRSGRKTNGNGKHSATKSASSLDGLDMSAEFDFISADSANYQTAESPRDGYTPPAKPETIRRRLSERMAALQFVEYVITAIEANFMGSSNPPFDDLQIKKALHTFEQACSDPESDEYFEAESALLLKLEGWEETLAGRDRIIPLDAVRQYTETANPPLSPQTLFALVRFYRAIEVSEASRAKLDFILTRLFSKFVDGERRDLLCSRPEIVQHLNQRYYDWSGGQYRRVSSDDSNTTLLVLSFDDFITEAASISDFDEMTAGGLLGRICEFKESLGEMFMLPEISAAAVECNIKVSNKVIELVSVELQRKNSKFLIDNVVLFNAVARTLNISSTPAEPLIKEEDEPKAAAAKSVSKSTERQAPTFRSAEKSSKPFFNLLGVNRWLLLATILTVVASLGLYLWSDYSNGGESDSSTAVSTLDLEKPELKRYMKVARLSGNTLYAIVTTEYEGLSPDAKREYLSKVLQAGTTKGYNRVSFINAKGKDVGYASPERIETGNK